MGSGGGWNPEEDVKKMVDNPVDTFISGLINVATAGTVGYEDGKIAAGVSVRAIDETIGELSGRNIARKQAMVTQDTINAAKTEQEKERLRQLQLQEANERMLSLRGASQSRRSQGGSGGIGGSGVEQQMAVDFLGL